jgi:hypothetical protein
MTIVAQDDHDNNGDASLGDDGFLFAARSREVKWSSDHEPPGDDAADKKTSPEPQ